MTAALLSAPALCCAQTHAAPAPRNPDGPLPWWLAPRQPANKLTAPLAAPGLDLLPSSPEPARIAAQILAFTDQRRR